MLVGCPCSGEDANGGLTEGVSWYGELVGCPCRGGKMLVGDDGGGGGVMYNPGV